MNWNYFSKICRVASRLNGVCGSSKPVCGLIGKKFRNNIFLLQQISLYFNHEQAIVCQNLCVKLILQQLERQTIIVICTQKVAALSSYPSPGHPDEWFISTGRSGVVCFHYSWKTIDKNITLSLCKCRSELLLLY